jgi:hypothetical protein
MLVEYLKRELQDGSRLVLENDAWAVLVPYWAVWPYETMVLPKRHVQRLDELNSDVCYSYIVICYDREASASTFNTLMKDLMGGNPLKGKAKMPGHSIRLKQYFKMTH